MAALSPRCITLSGRQRPPGTLILPPLRLRLDSQTTLASGVDSSRRLPRTQRSSGNSPQVDSTEEDNDSGRGCGEFAASGFTSSESRRETLSGTGREGASEDFSSTARKKPPPPMLSFQTLIQRASCLAIPSSSGGSIELGNSSSEGAPSSSRVDHSARPCSPGTPASSGDVGSRLIESLERRTSATTASSSTGSSEQVE